MAVPLRKRLLTIDDFYAMAESGILAEDERVELIRGELVEMAPIGSKHAFCVMILVDLLADLRPKVLLNPQNPLYLGAQQSIPQPDVVLLQRRDGYYEVRPPGPEDVLLLVEVADSSLSYDRDVKVPLYAESGVPEVWLVDLNSESISVFRRPSADGYLEKRKLGLGDRISLAAFPDFSLAVSEIFR
jgi:Uma2 family endonuclease